MTAASKQFYCMFSYIFSRNKLKKISGIFSNTKAYLYYLIQFLLGIRERVNRNFELFFILLSCNPASEIRYVAWLNLLCKEHLKGTM
jgi:hypothetical protein